MYEFIDEFARFFYSDGDFTLAFFRIFACLLVFGFVGEIVYTLKTLTRF